MPSLHTIRDYSAVILIGTVVVALLAMAFGMGQTVRDIFPAL